MGYGMDGWERVVKVGWSTQHEVMKYSTLREEPSQIIAILQQKLPQQN